MSPIFNSPTSRFLELQGIEWCCAQNVLCHKTFWEPYKGKRTPHVFIVAPSIKRSVRFALRPSVFNMQAILRQVQRMITNALDDPKMKLNTIRQPAHHICVTSVLKSYIQVLFTPWPAIYVLQDILRIIVDRMTPKWPWTL